MTDTKSERDYNEAMRPTSFAEDIEVARRALMRPSSGPIATKEFFVKEVVFDDTGGMITLTTVDPDQPIRYTLVDTPTKEA